MGLFACETTYQVWAAGSDVRRIAFSRDGKTLAGSGHVKTVGRGEHRTVRLWDVATKSEVIMEEPAKDVFSSECIAISPDGKLLAMGVFGQVFIWDVAARKVIHKLDAGRGVVLALAFSPDGDLLAYPGFGADESEFVTHLWDVKRAKVVGDVKGTGGSMAFSSDSKTLVTGNNKSMRLWDVKMREEILNIKTWAYSVALSPDGKTLASGDERGNIHLWDPATGNERLSIYAGGALSFLFPSRKIANRSPALPRRTRLDCGMWRPARQPFQILDTRER
jgi:WD40 repeat protein